MATGREKGGKNDKRDVSELFQLPQEHRTVGTCHVSLASLIDGENLVNVNSPCLKEKEGTENETAESTLSTGGGGKQNRKREKGDDKHQKPLAATKGKAGKNDSGKSANVSKGNKAGKGKERMEDPNDGLGEEEAPPPLPPLSIKLEVKLDGFTCTKDLCGKDQS